MKTELTETDKNKIVCLYQEGMSSPKIADLFCSSPGRILQILTKKSVKIRRFSDYEPRRTYKINHSTFDFIDTPEKAYWLGFLSADGNIGDNGRSVRLELSNKDVDHLYKFRDFVFSDAPIKNASKDCSLFCIGSSYMAQSLSKYGVVARKIYSMLTPKNIDPLFLRDFYRGIFDGDGWITNRYDEKRNKKYEIGFSAYNEDFLVEIKNWINSQLGTTHGYIIKRKRKNQQCCSLHFGGNFIVPKIYKLLFENSTSYLERKYKKFMEVLPDIQQQLVASKNNGTNDPRYK